MCPFSAFTLQSRGQIQYFFRGVEGARKSFLGERRNFREPAAAYITRNVVSFETELHKKPYSSDLNVTQYDSHKMVFDSCLRQKKL